MNLFAEIVQTPATFATPFTTLPPVPETPAKTTGRSGSASKPFRSSVPPLRRNSVFGGMAPFEPTLNVPSATAVHFCQLFVEQTVSVFAPSLVNPPMSLSPTVTAAPPIATDRWDVFTVTVTLPAE